MKAKTLFAGAIWGLPSLLPGQMVIPFPPVSNTLTGGPAVAGAAAPTLRIAVPVWPPDGDVSAVPVTESIFFNASVPEYVVVVRAPDGQIQRLLHAPLHNNGVIPAVSTTVSRDREGLFHYLYTVSNGPGAHSPIRRWAVATEEISGTIQLKHAEWTSGPAPSFTGLTNDRNRAFEWNGGGSPIEVGQTVSGFEIVSSLAPGYVMGAFYSASRTAELTADDWASMPGDIAARLHRYLATNWESHSLEIVGPRFAPGASPGMVERNFFEAIKLMEAFGLVPKDGPVTKDLDPRLLAALSGELPSANLQLESVTGLRGNLGQTESEVLSALKVTMDWLDGR